MRKVTLFFLQGGGFKGLEGQTAERVSRRLVRGRDGAAVDFYEVDGESPLHIQDVCKYDEYDVFIFICGKVFITQEGVNSLAKIPSYLLRSGSRGASLWYVGGFGDGELCWTDLN